MTSLSVADLIRARRYNLAVARMQDLCRVMDPAVPVDAEEVRVRYETTRARLRAKVPPAPFKVVVELVRS